MAKRSAAAQTITCTAVADAANFTDLGYPFVLQGASSTQRTAVIELYLGGESTSSTATTMVFGRDSTIGATSSGATTFDAALDPATAALAAPVVVSNGFTTKPQRSATLGHLLQLSFNAFGGIVRWVAAPGEEIYAVGNTASLGELSLTSKTGAGILSAHAIYETA